MLARGELCRGCGAKCNETSGLTRLEIADEHDPQKSWTLAQCPRSFVSEIVDEVNVAQMSEHHLPVTGGILDQSAWWVDMWMAFRSDCSQIDNDRQEREARKYG